MAFPEHPGFQVEVWEIAIPFAIFAVFLWLIVTQMAVRRNAENSSGRKKLRLSKMAYIKMHYLDNLWMPLALTVISPGLIGLTIAWVDIKTENVNHSYYSEIHTYLAEEYDLETHLSDIEKLANGGFIRAIDDKDKPILITLVGEGTDTPEIVRSFYRPVSP